MVPPKTDPAWRALLSNIEKVPVTGLSTKMLMTRLRLLLLWDKTEEKQQEAIKIAFDFFSKNEAAVRNDIKLIFGRGEMS